MTAVERAARRLGRFEPIVEWAAIGIGLTLTLLVLTTAWHMTDGLVYQQAGERLRSGEPLFPPLAPDVTRSYRYAPWFAAIWMLPIPPVLWIASMTICAVVSVIPGLRVGGWRRAVAALVFPYLLLSAMGGNVQAAMIAILVYGTPTRFGPLAIAFAASLKGFPLLYVLVYIGRRDWLATGVTLIATALLTAPILLFDLTHFPLTTEGSWGLYEWSPILWAVTGAAMAAYVLMQPSWLSASVLTMLARTKFVFYDVSYLLVGLGDRQDRVSDRSS